MALLMQSSAQTDLRAILGVSPGEMKVAMASIDTSLDLLERCRWVGVDPCCPECASTDTYAVGKSPQVRRRRIRQCRKCRKQFSWRHGTPFAGDRNHPSAILVAVHGFLVGATEPATVAAIVDLGVGEVRARRLVSSVESRFGPMKALAVIEPDFELPRPEGDLQESVEPPDQAPKETAVSIGPQAQPPIEALPIRALVAEQSLDVPGQGPGPWKVWAFQVVVLTLLAVLLVRTTHSQPQEVEEIWFHDGVEFKWVTPRLENEPYDRWTLRHEADVSELQAIYTPDKR